MNFDEFVWSDHPANPLIEPPFPDWIIADPTVMTPAESPDGRWHLFAHSILRGIHHYTSSDGIRWQYLSKVCRGMRPFIFKHENKFYLFYEIFLHSLKSAVAVRQSSDFQKWSQQQIVLRPSLPWHGKIMRTCGNPCVVRRHGEFLLFYSAGSVILKDCLFTEPLHIGIASSKHITGTYNPHPDPIISPDKNNPCRNLGAGAIKVIADEQHNILWGFNNGIYADAHRKSRSAILLLKSEDGLRWTQVHNEPIIKPTSGWKRALVYALDIKLLNGEAYLYYNARDGWLIGRERIGLTIGNKRLNHR